MKRTHVSTVVAFVLAGIVAGYLIDLAIVSAGGEGHRAAALAARSRSPASGVIVVALAWPIRRAVKGKATKHLDPFRAMRTAVLAKACSLSGALVFGFGVGHHAVPADAQRRARRPTRSGWRSPPRSAPALLLAGGLVAEAFCTLPPDDTETEKEEHAHA